MKANKELIQQIANGETTLAGEPVQVARTILSDGLYSKFSRFAFFYEGENNNLLDVQDLLLDFKCSGAEIRLSVDTDIHPSGKWQVFGMTMDVTLERLFEEISYMSYEVSERLENAVFSIRGLKGKFKYVSTYFHYRFGEGSITETELLEMIRVA